MKNPSEYHKEGYTCAEAIIKSYNEERVMRRRMKLELIQKNF